MANVGYKEIIGVCGLIGSGKTQVSSLISAERDYQYVNADSLFKEKVVPNPEYIRSLGEFLKIFEITPLVDGKYNSKGISDILFNESQEKYGFPVLRALNRLNAPFIEDALRDATFGCRDCIVEMATLPAFSDWHTTSRFDAVIIVMGDTWENDENNATNHLNRITKRDGRDPLKTLKILKHQMTALKPHLKNGTLFQLENMDTDFPEEEDCHFPEVYKKPEEILAQFDEIVKSARALKHMRIKHGVF